MPALYGLSSQVSNSLIAGGCVIEGTVENSVLFRGVRVAKGAVVRNSIIMQSGTIGEKAEIDCVRGSGVCAERKRKEQGENQKHNFFHCERPPLL